MPSAPPSESPGPEYGDRLHRITEVCLLAGKIILQNGGETQRVEDTMMRIAAAYGIERSHSFVMPTGIIFAIDSGSYTTRLVRMADRSTNLKKVSMVNHISRRIGRGELDAEEACKLLQEIQDSPHEYSSILKVLAATVASGCLLIMFGGVWQDCFPVAVIAGIGFTLYLLLSKYVQIRFFSEFLTSLAIGLLAILAVRYGLGRDLDKIIIGSVMPLVPGLHITNAVRDLMAGHLVSGLSKGAEAFLTAFAIGCGIAAVLALK
ncbi:threonine/serine exporter family protein [Paenibacillus sp. CAU 1782]